MSANALILFRVTSSLLVTSVPTFVIIRTLFINAKLALRDARVYTLRPENMTCYIRCVIKQLNLEGKE